MSLRTRLLLFFVLFAVVPLCGLGLYQYVRTQAAVERLIAGQTSRIAEGAANVVRDRWALIQSDVALLAQNAETQQLYRTRAGSPEREVALQSVAAYFQQVWQQIGGSYDRIELRDTRGNLVYRLGDDVGGQPASRSEAIRVVEPIRDERNRSTLGAVTAWPRLNAVLPAGLLEDKVGNTGYTAIIDRTQQRIRFHPSHKYIGERSDALFGEAADENLRVDGSGWLTYPERDSLRVASFVNLGEPAWTVVSVATLAEFASPFTRMRTEMLVLVLLVTTIVLIAFFIALQRATMSLTQLTRAAEQLGKGNFAPRLPPRTADEVGRLTGAFESMATRLADMVTQLDRSKQLAAIGAFSAEIAHEVRNPLTGVKLNLQRIDRMLRTSSASPEALPPLQICLREIARLERVVRGILRLGQPAATTRAEVSVHDVIRDVVALAKQDAEAQNVTMITNLAADHDEIMGDAERLRGMLLNLLINGIEAMPGGGELRVETSIQHDDAAQLIVRVADSGSGISDTAREQLFRPFFTTKAEGSGLGLAIALRAVEENGGTLDLEQTGSTGSTFRIALPLALTPVAT